MDERNNVNFFDRLKRLLMFFVALFLVSQVVAVLAYFAEQPRMNQGNIAAAKAQIKQFCNALESYKTKLGALPRSLEGLIKPPSGDPIMIAREVPLDPWGNAYQYSRVGTDGYVVMSLGADGEEGGDDEDADIRSDEISNENEKSSGALNKLNKSLPTDSHRFAQMIRMQRCV